MRPNKTESTQQVLNLINKAPDAERLLPLSTINNFDAIILVLLRSDSGENVKVIRKPKHILQYIIRDDLMELWGPWPTNTFS